MDDINIHALRADADHRREHVGVAPSRVAVSTLTKSDLHELAALESAPEGGSLRGSLGAPECAADGSGLPGSGDTQPSHTSRHAVKRVCFVILGTSDLAFIDYIRPPPIRTSEA